MINYDTRIKDLLTSRILILATCALFLVPFVTGCNYKFNDISIDPAIKTVRIQYIDNKARYINPQLSPQLTDRLRQKIVNQTRLTQVNNENADYDISGTITQYDVSTSGISSQQVATNRLTVGISLTIRDNKTGKEPRTVTASRSFDFSATLTLPQAEQRLQDDILRNLTDEIFNKIFSDW